MRAGIEGKVAVVTGGASGIGKATALAFAREGAKVVIVTARSLTAAAHVVQEIEDLGGEATYVPCDVTNEAQVAAMVEAAVARFGGIDFAFNNAGVGPDGVTLLFSPLDRPRGSRLGRGRRHQPQGRVPVHEARAAADEGAALGRDRQHVVDGGLQDDAGIRSVWSSKAAVMSLTRLAAAEKTTRGSASTSWRRDRPRVQGCRTAAELPKEGEGPPRHLMGGPEDVARVVLWLCSDEASFVPGNVIAVDGGLDVS